MIDWERVSDLHAEIGAEGFAEVVALFLEEADEVVARLATVSGAKALESELHFLKGSALNLGFSELSRLCQMGERRAAEGDSGVDLSAVTQCYAASKIAFETGLVRLGAIRAA